MDNQLLNAVLLARLLGGIDDAPRRRKKRKKQIIYLIPASEIPVYTASGGYPGLTT